MTEDSILMNKNFNDPRHLGYVDMHYALTGTAADGWQELILKGGKGGKIIFCAPNTAHLRLEGHLSDLEYELDGKPITAGPPEDPALKRVRHFDEPLCVLVAKVRGEGQISSVEVGVKVRGGVRGVRVHT
jgi:hypothetical protein